MTVVFFDPTERDNQRLRCEIQHKSLKWGDTSEGAGARLIQELKKLNLNSSDELRVVAGPGSFASIRIAAVVANTIAYLTGVQLWTQKVGEIKWQRVSQITPYYATAPIITPTKKC